jgi:PAS domain S-box-containing protein
MGIEQIKTILYFSGSVLIFLLGNYVYLKDPKRNLNKIFFLFSISATLWGFTAGLLRVIYPTYTIEREKLIKTKEVAKIFLLEDIASVGGYFLSSLFLHLCLIITEKKEILRKKIVQFIIYFPPTFLMAFIFITDFVFFIPLGKDIITGGVGLFLNIFTIAYFELYLFIAIFLLFKKHFSLKSPQEKRKLRYFLIGAFIPAFFGSVFTIILSGIFQIQTFSWLTFPLYTLGYIFVAIGVLKYGLFIDYREILETIFKRLSELVIITDRQGIILLTNEITPEKFGYKEKEEVIGKKMEEILKEGKERWSEISNKLREFGPILEEKTSFLTKEKKETLFLLNFSQTKEGLIFVGRDIKELMEYQERLEKEVRERTKELEEVKSVLEIKVKARTKELSELTQSLEEQVREKTKELQEKLEELEKFQKLAVGRELKMVELKKEKERLKGELEKYSPC